MSADKSKPEKVDLMKNLLDSMDQAALRRDLRSRDHLQAQHVALPSRDPVHETQIPSKTEDQHIVGCGFTDVNIVEWLAQAVRSGGLIELVEVRSKLPEKFFDDRSAGQERRITVRFANGAEFRSGWEPMS